MAKQKQIRREFIAEHTEKSLSSDRIVVVTSLTKNIYDVSGQRLIATFEKYWPDNTQLIVYTEDFDLPISLPRVKAVDLHSTIPQLKNFKDSFPTTRSYNEALKVDTVDTSLHSETSLLANGIINKKYHYERDAVRFSNKSFAIAHAGRTCRMQYEADILIWLDADVITFTKIPNELFRELLKNNAFVGYLGRQHRHTESGFLIFNLHSPYTSEFFETIENMYLSRQVFHLREWHDCEVFDVCRIIFQAQGKITSNNISAGVSNSDHPFINSVLGRYMDHLKGTETKMQGLTHARKSIGYSQESTVVIDKSLLAIPLIPNYLNEGRYTQINKIIGIVRPTTIVEVGTWSGHRAISMAQTALQHQSKVEYFGFDLFEDSTTEDDAREKNVKHPYTINQVARLLEEYSQRNPGFSAKLIKGDTRKILPDMNVDFAYIDGGHSVETIQSDYEHLKNSKVILFDDYYEGEEINTGKYGCNSIVKEIPHLILPIADSVTGGGTTKLVLASNEETLQHIKEKLSKF